MDLIITLHSVTFAWHPIHVGNKEAYTTHRFQGMAFSNVILFVNKDERSLCLHCHQREGHQKLIALGIGKDEGLVDFRLLM